MLLKLDARKNGNGKGLLSLSFIMSPPVLDTSKTCR